MSALGLEVYDAAGNMRPLNEVFRDLDSALSGMTEGEKTKVLNEIFNKVDLKSAQALLAGCGEEFDNLAAAIDARAPCRTWPTHSSTTCKAILRL